MADRTPHAPFSNQITRILDRMSVLPGGVRWRAFTLVFGKKVPYVATTGVQIESLSEREAVLTVPNKRRARNHVGGVHAAAIALLAETASGLLVGRNVRDDALPLVKSMHLDFVKRNYGDFRAVATLSPEQVEQIHTEPRGTFVVPVTLTDGRGEEPVRCEMVWAWVPRKA